MRIDAWMMVGCTLLTGAALGVGCSDGPRPGENVGQVTSAACDGQDEYQESDGSWVVCIYPDDPPPIEPPFTNPPDEEEPPWEPPPGAGSGGGEPPPEEPTGCQNKNNCSNGKICVNGQCQFPQGGCSAAQIQQAIAGCKQECDDLSIDTCNDHDTIGFYCTRANGIHGCQPVNGVPEYSCANEAVGCP